MLVQVALSEIEYSFLELKTFQTGVCNSMNPSLVGRTEPIENWMVTSVKTLSSSELVVMIGSTILPLGN